MFLAHKFFDPLSLGLQSERLKNRKDEMRDASGWIRESDESFPVSAFSSSLYSRTQEIERPSGLGLAGTRFCMTGHGLAELAGSHDRYKRGLRCGQGLASITWVEP